MSRRDMFKEIVAFFNLKASLLITYLCDIVKTLSVDKFTGSSVQHMIQLTKPTVDCTMHILRLKVGQFILNFFIQMTSW